MWLFTPKSFPSLSPTRRRICKRHKTVEKYPRSRTYLGSFRRGGGAQGNGTLAAALGDPRRPDSPRISRPQRTLGHPQDSPGLGGRRARTSFSSAEISQTLERREASSVRHQPGDHGSYTKNHRPSILYPAQLPFKSTGETSVCRNSQRGAQSSRFGTARGCKAATHCENRSPELIMSLPSPAFIPRLFRKVGGTSN